MPVTPASIKVIHPEFSQVDDAYFQIFIDRASRNVKADQWGARSDDATTELSCHLLAQAQMNGAAPPASVTSESVGSISASYSVGQVPDSELSATSYGRTYLEMKRLVWPARVF